MQRGEWRSLAKGEMAWGNRSSGGDRGLKRGYGEGDLGGRGSDRWRAPRDRKRMGGLASENGRRESSIGPDPAGVRGVRAAAW
jgi:hypothetical protein